MSAVLERQPTLRVQEDHRRERAVVVFFAGAAAAMGALAVVGSAPWLVTAGVVLLFVVAALTPPLPVVALILAALMPLQLYFRLPGSSYTLRAAIVVLFVAVLRVLIQRGTARQLARWGVWVIPAALFLLAALAAAFDAENKYTALKGIYDWLTIFATAFVVSEIARTAPLREKLAVIVVASGVAQAALGLVEYAAGSEAVLDVVRQPIAGLLLQPNLVAERLADLSFNWFLFERVTPFGTFINAIDYAIFVGTILSLVLSLLLVPRSPSRTLILSASAFVMGSALVLSLKGTGLLAFAGGAAAVALLNGRRFPARSGTLVLIVLVLAFVVALPFADVIGQRLTFVIEREQGTTGSVGRLDIWANLVRYSVQRPLVGFGLNNAIYLTEPTRVIRSGVAGLNPTAPENAYLALLVETGVIGFVGLVGFLAVTLLHAYRNARRSANPALPIGIFAAIVAMLIGNLTVTGFAAEQNGMLLGILTGMVFAKWDG